MTADEYADMVSMSHRFNGDIYIGRATFSSVRDAVRAAFRAGVDSYSPAVLQPALKAELKALRDAMQDAATRGASAKARQEAWGYEPFEVQAFADRLTALLEGQKGETP